MFERRARAYRTAQKDDALVNFDLVEKAVATRKAHRNAVDFDSGFIRAACASTADAPVLEGDDSCRRLYDSEPSRLTDAARAAAAILANAAQVGATVLATARSPGDQGHDATANQLEADAADAADQAAMKDDGGEHVDDITSYVTEA